MEKVNQKMKKFNLRGVLVGLRSSVTTPQKSEVGIEETLRSEHFQMAKTVCHGFPYQPTSLACDPVQNLLAIGTKNGIIKIFGRPGVEYDVKHEGLSAVTQLIFLINEGCLVSVTADDQLHMWTIKQKKPELVHSLKFQRERISVCHLPFQSKWLYIGTERGNVQIVNLESFTLSGYIVNWNKAMELIRLAHPGPVVHLSDNPIDPNKLLIGFETGSVVLWDFKNKAAEMRFSCSENLKSVCWHQDGKQFICSHADGSLTVWNTKQTQRPQSYMMPHAKLGKDGRPELCKAIPKVDYRSVRNGEPFIIFSGGTIATSSTPSLTVMHGNNMTVLEMEHPVVDFLVLCSTPWNNDFQDPHAIVVLLQNDLVVVDLTTPGYPCFENPYPMDIHESPVTTCSYFVDCPLDLVSAFYSVGCKRNRSGYSEKEWPIHGGEWTQTSCSYPEIIVTGHADGSVKFWDASSVTLQILYKLKTGKVFDPSKCRTPEEEEEEEEDSPFAVQHVHLCAESRLLCVAGSTHVVLFRFSKQEATVEFPVLDISIVYEVCDGMNTPDLEYPVMFPSKHNLTHQSGSLGSYSNIGPTNGKESVTSVKARSGSRKWPAGYQPDLCCLLTWIDNEPAPPITSLSVNSRFGLLAFGDECGVAVVDIIQKTCLLSMGTPDLYGSLDPYSRAPRSPKLKTNQKLSTVDHLSQTLSDDCRSPTVEQSAGSHKVVARAKGVPCQKRREETTATTATTAAAKQFAVDPEHGKKSALKTMSCPDRKEQPSPLEALERERRLCSLREDQKEEQEEGDLRGYIENVSRTTDDLLVAANRISKRASGLFDASNCFEEHAPFPVGSDDRRLSVAGGNVGSRSGREDGEKEKKEEKEERKEGEEEEEEEEQQQKVGKQENEEEEEDIDVYFKNYADSRKASLTKEEDEEEEEQESIEDILSREWKVVGSDWLAQEGSESSGDGALTAKPPALASSNSLKTDRPQHQRISPSRSVTMLKKLVSKGRRRRTNFIFNKSVSEDLTGNLESSAESKDDIPNDSSDQKSGAISSPDVYKLQAAAAAAADDDDDECGRCVTNSANSSNLSVHSDQTDGGSEAKKETKRFTRLVSGIFNKVVGTGGDRESERKSKVKRRLEVIDLSADDETTTTCVALLNDKSDSSFCRSHSSSTASLENVNKESIVCLVFTDAYTRKTDALTCPCLWLGTSLGTVLVISLTLPFDQEMRRREPVIVSPSGTIFRLKGSIMTISFLDCNGILIPTVAEQWKDVNNKTDSNKDERRSPYNRQSPAQRGRMSPTSSIEMTTDRQYSIICSEKQARVISLPSQTCVYKVKVTETSTVARADIVSFKDSVCLTCYVANGHVVVFSLPSLKPLLDVDCISSPNIRVAKTICFSNNCNGIYMCSPNEIQKITLSAEMCEAMKESMKDLYLPCNFPEAPKQSFFKNLFGGPTTAVDREELFGESSGKPSKGTTKYTPGPAGLSQEANSATSEIARAKMAAIERGEKLGELEERTERMKMEAEVYSQTAHQLKMKYKDKKWYQF